MWVLGWGCGGMFLGFRLGVWAAGWSLAEMGSMDLPCHPPPPPPLPSPADPRVLETLPGRDVLGTCPPPHTLPSLPQQQTLGPMGRLLELSGYLAEPCWAPAPPPNPPPLRPPPIHLPPHPPPQGLDECPSSIRQVLDALSEHVVDTEEAVKRSRDTAMQLNMASLSAAPKGLDTFMK